MAPGGTVRVTTAPAPTMARLPIIRPGRRTAPPPDGGAFTHGCQEKIARVDLRTGELVIGKRDIGTDKNIVFNPHPIPELDTALDCYPVADYHVILNKYVVADVAVLPYPGTRQNMRKSPNSRISPDNRPTFDQCLWVNIHICNLQQLNLPN